MITDPFKRSSLAVGVAIVILASLPVGLILLTGESIISNPDWHVSKFIILFYGGIILIFGYLGSLPINQLMMKYTDVEIEQPSIFGSKTLRWDEIKEVRNITTGNIVLVGSATKININPNLFVDTQRFFAELRSRIPETVFPGEAQINQEIIYRKRSDSLRSSIGAFIAAILAFVVGTNLIATVVVGLLFIAYGLYEIHRWKNYGREQP